MFRLRLLLAIWTLMDVALLTVICVSGTYFVTGQVSAWEMTMGMLVAIACEALFSGLQLHSLTSQKLSLRHLLLVSAMTFLAVSLHMAVDGKTVIALRAVLSICTAMPLGTLVIWACHIAYDPLMRGFLRTRPPVFPALLIGTTPCARSVLKAVEHGLSPLRVVGILTNDTVRETVVEDIPILGKLNKLPQLLAEKRITHVLHCGHTEQSCNIQSLCEQHGAVYVLPPCAVGMQSHGEGCLTVGEHHWTAENTAHQKWNGLFQ